LLFFRGRSNLGDRGNVAGAARVFDSRGGDKNAGQNIRESAKGENGEFFAVARVIDGDTFEVNTAGAIDTVRVIGIDTPEIADPRKSAECFGAEASSKAKEILSGQKVRLESDSSQGDRDKYGRLLRHVFLEDGTNFGLLMIKRGYAHEYGYPVYGQIPDRISGGAKLRSGKLSGPLGRRLPDENSAELTIDFAVS